MKTYSYTKFHDDCIAFIQLIEKLLIINKIDIDLNRIDHLCFRVETFEQYEEYKNLFLDWGVMLIESTISLRKISTFRLYKKIQYKNVNLDIIELPQPKKNNCYSLGLEHAEFVIEDSFNNFMNKYPELDFDLRSINKKSNPELCLSLNDGVNIKFHHLSLENLIKLDK